MSRMPAALAAPLVALQQPRALERGSELGVAEDQVVVGRVRGSAMVDVGLGGDANRRAVRLRRSELAPDEALADSEAPCEPVDIAPAQRQQLALSQPGHRCGEPHEAVDATERAV